jgi:hypothetical protein
VNKAHQRNLGERLFFTGLLSGAIVEFFGHFWTGLILFTVTALIGFSLMRWQW